MTRFFFSAFYLVFDGGSCLSGSNVSLCPIRTKDRRRCLDRRQRRPLADAGEPPDTAHRPEAR